jgi:hypothetical protein
VSLQGTYKEGRKYSQIKGKLAGGAFFSERIFKSAKSKTVEYRTWLLLYNAKKIISEF